MINKTTSLKITSLLLGVTVLFFATALKIATSPLFNFMAEAMFVEEGKNEQINSGLMLAESSVQEDDGRVVVNEMKSVVTPVVFLKDFDDSDYTFVTLSSFSKRVFFFNGVISSYKSVVYRKVKLFLFYSFIKIPTTV